MGNLYNNPGPKVANNKFASLFKAVFEDHRSLIAPPPPHTHTPEAVNLAHCSCCTLLGVPQEESATDDRKCTATHQH